MILVLIFVQDIRYRAVYWILFPLLMVGLFFVSLLKTGDVKECIITTAFNLLIVVFQLLALTFFFSIKKKQIVNITKGLLGWGDILFLVAVTVYFSPLNYLFFYVFSLTFALTLSLFMRGRSQNTSIQVPLAGFQAAIMILFLSSEWWFRMTDMADDKWLINLIAK